MKEFNKYVKEWQDLSTKLNEAMQKDNFEEADKLMEACNEAYENYKRCSSYPSQNSTMTFGELNYMLENELPRLFKEDKKTLKECVNFIKSDINLLSQFKFIDSLRNYNCNCDSISYVRESIDLASKGINKKTLKESIKKFGNLLALHEIGGCKLDEDTRKYYKACEDVLCESKKLTNLKDYTNNIGTIASYIEDHKKPVDESKENVNKLIENLTSKIANLAEDEQRLLQDIIDFKQPTVEARQEKLFNKFKNECLETIKNLVSESNNSDDLNGLNSIKVQLENKEYCKESIVQDIAKLLEIRDILKEK